MINYTNWSKKNFEKYLFLRFKFLYRDHKLPSRRSSMRFGLQCERGWYNLIYNLSIEVKNELKKNKNYHKNYIIYREEPCSTLEDINKYNSNLKYVKVYETQYKLLALLKMLFNDFLDRHLSLSEEGFRVTTVKEKFATLCYYYSPSNENINKIIKKYSNLSEITCENCGKNTGENNIKIINNWRYNRCDKCYAQLLKEKNINFGLKEEKERSY